MVSYSPLDYVAVRSATYAADPRIGTLLSMAENETGAEFGTNRNRAIALLALHWISMDDRDSGGQAVGGTVSAEQEGSLRRQYLIDFTLTSRYPDLTQTRWGMERIGLQKGSLIGPRTRFCT